MNSSEPVLLSIVYTCSIWTKIFGKLRFTRSARVQKILGTVQEFWGRETSDDLLYIFLVLIDAFVVEVSSHLNFAMFIEPSYSVFKPFLHGYKFHGSAFLLYLDVFLEALMRSLPFIFSVWVGLSP